MYLLVVKVLSMEEQRPAGVSGGADLGTPLPGHLGRASDEYRTGHEQ